MERSAANSDKGTKADSSKESASRIKPVGENDRKMEIDPFRSLMQGSGCRGCGTSLESVAQRMASMPAVQRRQAALSLQRTRGNRFVQGVAVQAKREPNRTGMPDGLKVGIESLTGIDMSDVRVHVNSDKPSRLNALAYTQGDDIHLAPGQERHLSHEAWHVVQQKQGRVRATTQMKGLGINDDPSLEHEADMMGSKAAQFVSVLEAEEPVQGKFGEGVAQKAEKMPNNTSLPDNSEAGIENLSGIGMDRMKVQCNSRKLTQLNARAYTQGTDFHMAPEQERRVVRQVRSSLTLAQCMKCNATITVEKQMGAENNETTCQAEGQSGPPNITLSMLALLPNQTAFIRNAVARDAHMMENPTAGACSEPAAVANALQESINELGSDRDATYKIKEIKVDQALADETEVERWLQPKTVKISDNPSRAEILNNERIKTLQYAARRYYAGTYELREDLGQGIARRCPTCASWIGDDGTKKVSIAINGPAEPLSNLKQVTATVGKEKKQVKDLMMVRPLEGDKIKGKPWHKYTERERAIIRIGMRDQKLKENMEREARIEKRMRDLEDRKLAKKFD